MYNWAEQKYLEDLDVFNGVVRAMQAAAIRDLNLEGYVQDQIAFKLELDMRYGSQYKLTSVEAPVLLLRNVDDVRVLCDAFYRPLFGSLLAGSDLPEWRHQC